MSVWKKASKVNQKVHRERSQPADRQQLGLLEKHKDYKKRAVHHNNQKHVLHSLHKKALDRNPDEFYHHMINSKVHEGVHHEHERKEEDTPEQIQLMHSQDIKYVQFKRTQEQKKIERLQAQLHLSSVNQNIANSHKRFKRNTTDTSLVKNNLEHLCNFKIPDVNITRLKNAAITRKQKYMELAKRIERERELSVIQEKLHIKKQISGKSILKPKRMRKGSKDSAPIYKWKYERKH
ncbi:hypothetical protein PPYR_04315 [Photinus pyralis]|uniref:U3 small nucleolar RNA-associated protein 11 n=1 Tax=Photinus pyralis TaxID=7054 RepID=A0A1Y1KRG5_PHOPY|nr:probable U3 small nucleolar RNA-associated protein 11 [Photinus pyralis]KAB0802129.1 hypothetical protein PPYR_04315 [Photinus pyralis]